MRQLTGTVISNQAIKPTYFLMWLEAADIAAAARPGQFIMVRCGGDTMLPRPFSIHRRDSHRLALLFQTVGRGTEWLAQRQAGDTLELFGPLGNGFSIDPASQSILLVAGGIGIAPLVFLADEAIKGGRAVILLQGAQAEAKLYPEHLLPKGTNLITATETGQGTMVTELIPDFTKEADQLFACGPLPMYRTMSNIPELKDKSVQVSLEVRMGCGLGVCYGCTIKTVHGLKQVCKDGPVFDFKEIYWDYLSLI